MGNGYKIFKQAQRKAQRKYEVVEFHWTAFHIQIIEQYFSNISMIVLPCAKLSNVIATYIKFSLHKRTTILAKKAASYAQGIRALFTIPCPKMSMNKKYQLLESFISFLIQLLHRKPSDSIVSLCNDRIENLEKELRFLLTVIVDTSLALCAYDHEPEFKKILAEFEAVVNEAGGFVHSLLFSINRSPTKMDKSVGVLLNHVDLLKVNTMKLLNLVPFFSRSTYIAPRTSVIDSLIIVESLIYDLEGLMNREDKPIDDADVNDKVQTLQQWFIFLWCCIRHIGSPRPSEIEELREPLRRIGDMAYEAEYLMISFLVGDAPSWYLINRLTDVNHKIEAIGAELQGIRNGCKFGNLKIVAYFNTQQSSRTHRNTEVDDDIVGFEDKATDVLHWLVGGTDHLQVISIFGMPGLGKTTVAKKLYNHISHFHRFDKVSWCVVSQTYVRRSLLTNILLQIASEPDEDKILEMEEERLAEHIFKTLKARRYLIVLDDIWDSNVWDDLQCCFPNDGNGSRVLFTTRNKDVAPPNSVIYALQSLSNDQCWELLEKKVFGDKQCPPELLETGRKIAVNCQGLPLAVVVVAGVLSSMEKDKNTWEKVRGNIASYIFHGGDNSVMQILELSYKHLPDHLKPCFLYFGAFQKGKEIPVQNMMRLWIAEGFVCMGEEKSAEIIAEEYLMELIDKSLVMVAKRRLDGGVKACAIHDLLHDLCLKVSGEENFLNFVTCDNYSIHDKTPHRLQALDTSASMSYCQHAHSLHCQSYCARVHSFQGYNRSSPFYVRGMKLLRVLDFNDFETNLHVRPIHFIGIEYLINLRYLVIGHVPRSISGNLINLEYLRVRTNEIVYLPPAVLKMKKLRYLQLWYIATYDEDCDSSQTNHLESLSGIRISKIKDEEILKCSPHLRKLKCTCIQLSRYPHFDLRSFTQLESLKVEFHGLWMKEISFSSNIRKLTLSDLRFCEEKMSTVGRLEKLEVFKLECSFFAEERWNTRNDEFQKLRFFKMDRTDLSQWNVESSEHFPKLERLILTSCRNLQEIPCEIGDIATLQVIQVKEPCPDSLVESAERIQQEQWDMGNELRIIISV